MEEEDSYEERSAAPGVGSMNRDSNAIGMRCAGEVAAPEGYPEDY